LPADELLLAIRQVHAGKRRLREPIAAQLVEHMGQESLAARKVEVLMSGAEGNRNQDVGAHLGISEETVKVHIKHIMEKLGAKDRTQAITIAIRRGMITL
jgi:DNA-binding NarL/FixJ family response regulator